MHQAAAGVRAFGLLILMNVFNKGPPSLPSPPPPACPPSASASLPLPPSPYSPLLWYRVHWVGVHQDVDRACKHGSEQSTPEPCSSEPRKAAHPDGAISSGFGSDKTPQGHNGAHDYPPLLVDSLSAPSALAPSAPHHLPPCRGSRPSRRSSRAAPDSALPAATTCTSWLQLTSIDLFPSIRCTARPQPRAQAGYN